MSCSPLSPPQIHLVFFLPRATGFAREPMDSRFRRETGREPEEPAGRPTLVSLRVRGVTCRRVNTASCQKQRNIESNSPSTGFRLRHCRMFITQGQSESVHTSGRATYLPRRSEMYANARISRMSVRRRERLLRARAARTSVRAAAPALRGTNKCRIAIKSADTRRRRRRISARREIATYARAARPFPPDPRNTGRVRNEGTSGRMHIRVLLALSVRALASSGSLSTFIPLSPSARFFSLVSTPRRPSRPFGRDLSLSSTSFLRVFFSPRFRSSVHHSNGCSIVRDSRSPTRAAFMQSLCTRERSVASGSATSAPNEAK